MTRLPCIRWNRSVATCLPPDLPAKKKNSKSVQFECGLFARLLILILNWLIRLLALAPQTAQAYVNPSLEFTLRRIGPWGLPPPPLPSSSGSGQHLYFLSELLWDLLRAATDCRLREASLNVRSVFRRPGAGMWELLQRRRETQTTGQWQQASDRPDVALVAFMDQSGRCFFLFFLSFFFMFDPFGKFLLDLFHFSLCRFS